TAARTTRRKPRPAPRRAERKTAAMTNKSRRVMCTAVSYLCSRMPSAYQGAGSCFLARRPAGLRQNWSRFGAGHARAQPRNIAPFSCPSAFWILPISQSPARFHTSKLQENEEEPPLPPVSVLRSDHFAGSHQIEDARKARTPVEGVVGLLLYAIVQTPVRH